MSKKLIALLVLQLILVVPNFAASSEVQLGPRPVYLVDDMDEGELKNRLNSSKKGPFSPS